MIYFSQTTNGFYDDNIHSTLPNDVVVISDELHQSLLSAQYNGDKDISADENGNPILIDRVKLEPTYDTLRKANYPSIQDQLDLLYHGGYDGWKEQITLIKDKYPKPNN